MVTQIQQIDDAPVQLTNVSEMTNAFEAAGAIAKMEFDASAQSLASTQELAQADAAAAQAAGEAAEAKAEIGQIDNTTEFTLGAIATIALDIAAPGAGMIAAASAAASGAQIYNDRTSSSGSGDKDGGAMEADDWVMRKPKMNPYGGPAQNQPAQHADGTGYVRRIDSIAQGQSVSLAGADRADVKGISYYKQFGEAEPSTSSEVDAEEVMARSQLAEQSLSEIHQINMTSGFQMNQQALGFAAQQRALYQPEAIIQNQPAAAA